MTWIPDSDFEFARRAIRRLDLRIGSAAIRSKDQGRPASGRAKVRWERWLETASALEACGRQIAHYRHWPVRLDAGIRGIQPTSVSEGWFDSVTLAAIARSGDDRDILTQIAFWKAVSAIGELGADARGFSLLRARIARKMKARLEEPRPKILEEIMDGIDGSLEKLPAAGKAYEKMMAGMAAVVREMDEMAALVRKCDGKLAKARKDRGAISEERGEAAERLSRLQARIDGAKSEFRANHFPAIFLPETDPEEALAGEANR
ncbi:MAG TPA: hypothetical protein VIU29_03465 [Candidatus Deferrimicrobiaceae bacterium]